MKFGMRKPSLKKSFKARTTSNIKELLRDPSIPFMERKE